MKREIWELFFESMLPHIREWEPFTVEEMLDKIQSDETFKKVAQEEKQHISLYLGRDGIVETTRKMQEYLLGNKYAIYQAMDAVNRKRFLLADSGKEVKALGSISEYKKMTQLARIEQKQDRQDDRMIYLTWILAVCGTIGIIPILLKIREYVEDYCFEWVRCLYFVFGVFSVILFQLFLYSLRKERTVKKKRD